MALPEPLDCTLADIIMPLDMEPLEQWMGTYKEEKLKENERIMAQHGMDLRRNILFASLCIERVANVVRNLELGRTAKHGPMRTWGFDKNIKFLFEKGLIGSEYAERFHAFRQFRNAFIHDLDCKDMNSLARIEPRPIELMRELAEKALQAVIVPLERTEDEKLGIGLNIITNSVIQECGRIVEAQAQRRKAK